MPRGAELEKSAQKIKGQSHFLRCYAPRCLIAVESKQPVSNEAAFTVPALRPENEWASKWQSAVPPRHSRYERGLSGPSDWPCGSLVSQRTPGEIKALTKLVEIRGSSLSDAGSIPAISTLVEVKVGLDVIPTKKWRKRHFLV